MFEKYLKPENLKPEHILEAYTQLKEYAAENNTTVKKIIADKENIPVAAEYIHKKLPFTARMILNKEKLGNLILEHYDFIKSEAIKIEKVQKANEALVTAADKSKKSKK